MILETDLSAEGSLDIIADKLDILSYIDHVIAFVYWNNVDWYGDKHFRIWRTRNISSRPYEDGKFRFIVWDFDAALTNGAGFNTLVNWIDPNGGGNDFATGNPEKTRLLRKLLSNEAFKNLFLNRFNDLINSAFQPERVIEIANAHYQKIAPEFDRHFDRWNFYPSSIDQKYAYKNYLTRFTSYSQARPSSQRGHLRNAFNLSEDIQITIDVNDLNAGFVQLNSIDLTTGLEGTKENVYPWKGVYFKNIPLILKAKPKTGFEFDFWLVNGQTYYEETIEINPENALEVMAFFKVDLKVEKEIFYYWLFDDSVPNNTPLLTVDPIYQLDDELDAKLTFVPAISPYPLSENNTNGIMDRVNDPTLINFQGERLGIIPFAEANMRGIRTRNPLEVTFDGETRRGYLVFEMPTPLYKDLVFKAAVSRTNNGPESLTFEYSIANEDEWVNDGISIDQFELSTNFELLELDLSNLTEINNNTNFKLKLGFKGNTGVESGNVRFNNISLEGLRFDEKDLITGIPINPREEKNLIRSIFPNPSKKITYVEFFENSFREVDSIQFMDMQGRTIKEIYNPQSRVVTLDMETWKAGTYIIKVISSDHLEIKRLIKN